MLFKPDQPFDLPLLPPAISGEDTDLLKALIRARTTLASLDGSSRALPNPLLLISPLIMFESVASSEIEGIHTTVVNALQAELFPETPKQTPDKEVLRYRDAMLWGYKNVKKVGLSTRLILGIHGDLMEGKSEYRRQQNAIHNISRRETIYTPPIASRIPNLMSNWENFVNNASEDYDPVLRCAVAHYQFEAIHPFSDGNGRTGRILMILHLVEAGILKFPILFLSEYLNRNRPQYYAALRNVTIEGKWKDYLLFMLKGFETQAQKMSDSLVAIIDLIESTKAQVRKKLPKIFSTDLVNHLFSSPVTSPVRLAQALDVHYITASKYLQHLRRANFLTDKKLGKYHLYFNAPLLKLLS